MTIVTKETLKADEEKADEILSGIGAEPYPAAQPPIEEETPPVEVKDEEPTNDGAESEGELPTATDADKMKQLQDEMEELKNKLIEEGKWKDRYSTLQGMFNKMSDELKELKQQPEKPSTTEQQPTDTSQSIDKLANSEALNLLKKDYGDAIIDDIKALIFGVATSLLDGRIKAYEGRVAKVEETQGKTKKETFFTTLNTLVPDWKLLNGWEEDNIPQDPKFTQFLLSEVPGTTYTYHQVLNTSYAAYNANAVAKIFNLFKSNNEPPATDLPPKPSKSKEVERHIDPGASGGGAVQTDKNKKKTYSMVVINKFYDDVTKKKFTGTSDERRRLDDEYQTAIIEGRVY